ncbi:MAG: AAA family ATPase, partial [Bacteroidota bacterium]|nr:AAA family ATPase [Bacteroidota bacterium]
MKIIAATVLLSLIKRCSGFLKMIKINVRKPWFRSKNNSQLFDQSFIEAKVFYMKLFDVVPCSAYIGNVNTKKIFELIKEEKYGKVKETYQRLYHDWVDDKTFFSKVIFVIENKLMVKLADDWLEIYFTTEDYARANKMLEEFKMLKAPEKDKDYEINIISLSDNQLNLKTLDIKPTPLDIGLYYNDDFKIIDTLIKERLAKENDKGIVLLHGLPGTGKTTYLRYLIGNLKKKVMFVSPSVAGNLMNPEFMDLLLCNPNSVLVIEDAENIIMDRKYSSNSSVSNLLNISDGLLSDCLNVQIICTFNSEIGLVDNALLRKGRLIARYEFGKLSVQKAVALSNHLGLENVVTMPMTLAEITNPEDNYQEPAKTSAIGFRREMLIE